MESVQTNLEKSRPMENRPPLDKVVTLFFLSFRFSQGIPKKQQHIFKYLALEHPNWRMSKRFIDDVKTRVTPRIKKFLVGSKKSTMHSTETDTDDKTIESTIRSELDEMTSIFNRKDKTESREALLLIITEGIIQLDNHYLVHVDGRTRKTIGEQQHVSVSDPYLSHLCYYGLEGNKTGAEEYDKMFQEAKETLWGIFAQQDKSYQNNIIIKNFVEIVNKYVEAHPDKKEIMQQKIPDNVLTQITSLS